MISFLRSICEFLGGSDFRNEIKITFFDFEKEKKTGKGKGRKNVETW